MIKYFEVKVVEHFLITLSGWIFAERVTKYRLNVDKMMKSLDMEDFIGTVEMCISVRCVTNNVPFTTTSFYYTLLSVFCRICCVAVTHELNQRLALRHCVNVTLFLYPEESHRRNGGGARGLLVKVNRVSFSI